MEELLDKYGYFAVMIGTILEGGTLLTMAGFLSHQGYLKLIPWVIAAGFAGNFIDTLVCYCIGRAGGNAIVRRHPMWGPRLHLLHDWLLKYPTLTIVGVRFVPGLRTAGGMAIGMAGISPGKFLPLNALGAVLWASTIGGVGYLFGHLIEAIMGDLKRYELPIIIVLAVAGILTCLFFFKYQRGMPPAEAQDLQDRA